MSCIAINWPPAGTVKAGQLFPTSPVGALYIYIYMGNTPKTSL